MDSATSHNIEDSVTASQRAARGRSRVNLNVDIPLLIMKFGNISNLLIVLKRMN